MGLSFLRMSKRRVSVLTLTRDYMVLGALSLLAVLGLPILVLLLALVTMMRYLSSLLPDK
jgi:nitrate reductase gamma subunit